MSNDTPSSTSEAKSGSPLPLVIVLIAALFAGAYFVRSNPTAAGPSLSSTQSEDAMPAAFKKHLPWKADGKDVKDGPMGLQYVVLRKARKTASQSPPTA